MFSTVRHQQPNTAFLGEAPQRNCDNSLAGQRHGPHCDCKALPDKRQTAILVGTAQEKAGAHAARGEVFAGVCKEFA